MRRVGPRRDVVLLLLPLVLPNHEPRRARASEEGGDGRAYGHDEILDECLHVWVHTLLLPPINFPSFFFRKKKEKDSYQGLESRLIICFDNLMHPGISPRSHFSFFQLEKYFSPTGKVIFQRFLNHDAKIQKQPPSVVRWWLMPCDGGTFFKKI